MAQYSMSTGLVQRSAGNSAVAHAAYVSGGRFVDQRTGQEADYTRRAGVMCVAPAIVLPAGELETQSAQIDRVGLWNMAEAAEKRKDANPARKILVALPHELGPEMRLAMTQEYAQWIANRYHVAVDFAIHAPDKDGDQKNYHAHLIQTTREIHNGQLTEKAQLEWKGSRLKAAELPSGKAMVHELRQQWESVHNDFLSRNAPAVEKVSCKRLTVQREYQLQECERLTAASKSEEATEARLKAIELDRTPQTHVGFDAAAMERRLARKKAELEKNGMSITHLPEFATDRGAARAAAQREHKERQSFIAQVRKQITQIWTKAVEVIHDLTHTATPTQPAQVAELPPPPEPTRAERTNALAIEIANRVETSAGRGVKLTNQEAELVGNLLLGVAMTGKFYDSRSGRGAEFVKAIQSREDAVGLRGICDLEAIRTKDGYDYRIIPWRGKVRDLVAELRKGAEKQLKWDKVIEQKHGQRQQERERVKDLGR